MKIKKIEKIILPRTPHFVGDGFRVHNFIPGSEFLSMERMSPFILLDYNSDFYFPPSKMPLGVGSHPHRGFETVTIAYKGKIAHKDSTGASGIIREGDVQWMTAGSGVLHKEYHEEEFSKQGGNLHMVQLWVNLPAQYKMNSPNYQAILNSNMGKYELDNGCVEVIAGSYKEIKGPAHTFSPVNLYNVKLNKGGDVKVDFPANYNTAFVIIDGKVEINDRVVEADSFVLFENNGEEIAINAIEKCIVLMMSAEPLAEPIAAQGPFVMNTREELIQAFEDFNLGKFGSLD